MTKPMTAVSYRGDKEDLMALKAIAAAKGLAIGDLITEAVNTVFGDELKPYQDYFRAKNGRKNVHNGQSGDNKTKPLNI